MSDAIARMRNPRMDEFGCDLDGDHPKAGLLNGPALEGQGVGQAYIDELLDVAADGAEESGAAEPCRAPPGHGLAFLHLGGRSIGYILLTSPKDAVSPDNSVTPPNYCRQGKYRGCQRHG